MPRILQARVSDVVEKILNADESSRYLKKFYPKKPEGELPSIPAKLTELSYSELGEYVSLYTSWYAYLSGLLAEADIEKSKYDEALNYVFTSIKKELSESGEVSKKDAEELAKLDERYIQMLSDYMRAKDEYIRLQALTKTCEMWVKMLSREISRRSIEAEFAKHPAKGKVRILLDDDGVL